MTSTSSNSRFVSQGDLDKKLAERQAEWNNLHERLGQAPPPLPEDSQPYDSRPLYEQLQSQKDKKQEEFEAKISLKNQFRGLDEEEAGFLAEQAREEREAERRRREDEQSELERYRQAIAAKPASVSTPSASSSTTSSASSVLATSAGEPLAPSAAKHKGKPKTQRTLLAGVIKKKKESGEEPAIAPKAPVAKKRRLEA